MAEEITFAEFFKSKTASVTATKDQLALIGRAGGAKHRYEWKEDTRLPVEAFEKKWKTVFGEPEVTE